jgi:hypothetical protein
MDNAPPWQSAQTPWLVSSPHDFAHLGSDCNTVTANLTILYATVQFSLHAEVENLPLLRDLPGYHACVKMMEQAGAVPKEHIIHAHQSLMKIVTEKFWPTMIDLSQEREPEVSSVATMLSRPRYVLRLRHDDVRVDGPFASNSYCVQPIPVETTHLAVAIVTHQACDLIFITPQETSPSLAGIVQLPTGDIAWFKPSEEMKTESFFTELAALQRLEARHSVSDGTLRVPRLQGVAVTGDGKNIVGTLTTAIIGKMLAACDTEERLRNKVRWRQQVEEAVRTLHSCGIIWGDANETNVMIDKEGDAWLIDLEGGEFQEDDAANLLSKQEVELENVAELFAMAKD